MHEWSLATGVLQTITDECSKLSITKVERVDLNVGEMAQIEIPLLRQALKSMKKGTVMEESTFRISKERTSFACRNCGRKWSFSLTRKKLTPLQKGGDNAVHYIPSTIGAFESCPDCGSPDFDIISGFGLSIKGFTPARRDANE